MASKYFKAFNFFKSKVSPTIKSVKPNVGKSKLQKALGDVNITALKTKGQIKKRSQDFDAEINKVKAKLGQTTQKIVGEPVTKSGVSKGKDMKKFKTPSLNPKPINKATGGRVGLKRGTGLKRKSNVQKIKETFGPKQKPQSRMTRKKKFPDLTGDGKVTFADILKGRGVINGKKKKKVI